MTSLADSTTTGTGIPSGINPFPPPETATADYSSWREQLIFRAKGACAIHAFGLVGLLVSANEYRIVTGDLLPFVAHVNPGPAPPRLADAAREAARGAARDDQMYYEHLNKLWVTQVRDSNAFMERLFDALPDDVRVIGFGTGPAHRPLARVLAALDNAYDTPSASDLTACLKATKRPYDGSPIRPYLASLERVWATAAKHGHTFPEIEKYGRLVDALAAEGTYKWG